MLSGSIIFGAIVTIIFAVDLWLVMTGRTTISVWTWLAERAHPTLIAGVTLLGVGAGYITWEKQLMIPCFMILISTGHLITSEGAAVATKANWKKSIFAFSKVTPTAIPGEAPTTQPKIIEWPFRR